MVTIRLNGEEKSFEESLTISELLRHLNISFQAVAVAVNSEVVPCSAFERIKLRNRDSIEIIRPVGGG